MYIREVVLQEAYVDNLVVQVQDLLSQMMTQDVDEISTERFRTILAKQGYTTSLEELIQAVNDSGFASSVDGNKIVPADELSGDVDTDAEPTVDVSAMAGNQAMSDIKADL